MGTVPARAIVVLDGTALGEDGARTVPFNEHGVRRLILAKVGTAVQVTVELDSAREVRAAPLGDGAVLVDIQKAGTTPSSDLPNAAHLQAWIDGVSLVRVAGAEPADRKLVVVDAGHGGFDSGAIGLTGTRESDVALEIAHRVAEGLKEELGLEVIMTRSTDHFVPLQERAAIANQADADLFISIHANAAAAPTAWGIETYWLDTASDAGAARVASRENALVRAHQGDLGTDPLVAQLLASGTNQLSQQFAGEVQSGVVKSLQTVYGDDQIRDLGTKTALFYVLVSTRMPAVLFEASFLTNPDDERRLRSPYFQQSTADAIVTAVGNWFSRQG